uniref:Uncharacterized protein n=1 Tax=Oncorhynchus mykiss TaxID=8022 RepID=A0A8C7PJW6_ONCMY
KVDIGAILSLQLITVLWGCTNPYPKRSTEGIEHVKREIKFHQFLAEVKFLFLNLKVNLHLGSLVYYFTLYDCFTHRLLMSFSSGLNRYGGLVDKGTEKGAKDRTHYTVDNYID